MVSKSYGIIKVKEVLNLLMSEDLELISFRSSVDDIIDIFENVGFSVENGMSPSADFLFILEKRKCLLEGKGVLFFGVNNMIDKLRKIDENEIVNWEVYFSGDGDLVSFLMPLMYKDRYISICGAIRK